MYHGNRCSMSMSMCGWHLKHLPSTFQEWAGHIAYRISNIETQTHTTKLNRSTFWARVNIIVLWFYCPCHILAPAHSPWHLCFCLQISNSYAEIDEASVHSHSPLSSALVLIWKDVSVEVDTIFSLNAIKRLYGNGINQPEGHHAPGAFESYSLWSVHR